MLACIQIDKLRHCTTETLMEFLAPYNVTPDSDLSPYEFYAALDAFCKKQGLGMADVEAHYRMVLEPLCDPYVLLF